MYPRFKIHFESWTSYLAIILIIDVIKIKVLFPKTSLPPMCKANICHVAYHNWFLPTREMYSRGPAKLERKGVDFLLFIFLTIITIAC